MSWSLEQDASLVVLETIIGERETVIYYSIFWYNCNEDYSNYIY